MSLLEQFLTFLDVTALLLFFLFTLACYIYIEWKRVRKLPPGPTGIPFLGYGPFIDTSKPLWRLSQDLSKRYKSDITSMNIFGKTLVFITNREAVKEAFQKRYEMAKRPKTNFFKTMDPTHEGLIMSSGSLWKEQRRFSLMMLRDFGMGKIAAEQSIQDEAVNLCKHFQDLGRQTARDPIKLLEPAVSNIICSIAFGRRFSYDDPKLIDALNALNYMSSPKIYPYVRIVMSPSLLWLASILYPNIKRNTQKKYVLISEFIQGMIAEHKVRFDGSVNDLIDGFLLEQSKRTDANHSFTDQQLRQLIFDLFFAGSETTTATLRWALLYLIRYPDIQERIHDEIHSVVGSERVPGMLDKKSTPYTEAFLLEIQRFNTIVPISVGHSCSEDLQFMDYTIPANSLILSILAAMHRDPRIFKDPDIFRPERFLDGDKLIDADKLDQFGIGRRACVGESLARMEIYIFFTTMVQRLQFVSAKNQNININQTILTAIQAPDRFLLHAISRHQQ